MKKRDRQPALPLVGVVRNRSAHIGEQNPRAKLTWAIVGRVRASREPAEAVARRLGVSMWTVYSIRQGKTWTKREDEKAS